jgi:hypothetical protein
MRQSRNKSGNRRRARLVDRLQLWWSTSKRIDGLWVGTIAAEPAPLLQRVERALDLIKSHDRVRYDRLIQDIERVWVRVVPHGIGAFNEAIDACELDTRFVRAETSTAEQIAALIVHEATHARLLRSGIDYGDDLRARVEAVCFRREIAFATKLPNGAQVRESAERNLKLYSDDALWTDAALEGRHVKGASEALRYLGVPNWVVRTTVAARLLRLRIINRMRESTRRKQM